MLSRLLLMLFQLVAGWYGTLAILPHLPDLKKLKLFVAAGVVTVIVWLVGAVANIVLKDVARPSAGTFIFALAVAVILTMIPFVPDAERAIVSVVGPLPNLAYPLIGAVLGYAISR